MNKEALILQQILIDISDQFAFQIEVAPKTGYIHFQGFLGTKNQMRHTAIQAHLEKYQLHFHYIAPVAKNSTPKQAFDYATKADTRLLGPFIHGTPPDFKDKTPKIQPFIDAIKQGKTDMELLEEHPGYMTRHLLAHNIRTILDPTQHQRPYEERMKIMVFYGAPGCGKSFLARKRLS